MSQFRCTCGNVIRDQADRLPYKAQFLRDYDEDAVYEALSRECEALIAAVAAGDRESWLRRHFLECYPRDLSNGAVFHDFVNSLLIEYLDTMYECEECGRLWVQRPGAANEFAAFVPEGGHPEQVLRSPRDQRHTSPGDADFG